MYFTYFKNEFGFLKVYIINTKGGYVENLKRIKLFFIVILSLSY